MIIPQEALRRKLIRDLRTIGMPVDEVELSMRPYSKMYYGNYFPQYDTDKKPRIYIYPCKTVNGLMYEYDFILDTTIHEMVHHIQHTTPGFVRLKGVMHDQEFWQMYNRYIYKAKLNGVISGEYKSKAA